MKSSRRIEIAEQLLTECRLTLDRLPYTSGFEEVYAKFVERFGMEISRHDVWWTLLHVRKRGLGPSGRKH
jgi:hypothetical protein